MRGPQLLVLSSLSPVAGVTDLITALEINWNGEV